MKYVLSLLFILVSHFTFSQLKYPGTPPGIAKGVGSSQKIYLENAVVKIVFQVKGNRMHPLSFTDKVNRQTLNLLPLKWFELTIRNGDIISNENFEFLNKPLIKSIARQKKSARYSDRLPGKMIEASFITCSK